jgi:hypothetical protein
MPRTNTPAYYDEQSKLNNIGTWSPRPHALQGRDDATILRAGRLKHGGMGRRGRRARRDAAVAAVARGRHERAEGRRGWGKLGSSSELVSIVFKTFLFCQ